MEKKQFILKSFLALTLVFVFSSCKHEEKAQVKFIVREFADKQLIIEEQRVAGAKTLDSARFSFKGKLSYTLYTKQAAFYTFSVEQEEKIYLLLHPGEKVRIGKENGKLILTGSEDSKKLVALYDSLFATRRILADIRQDYNQAVDPQLRDSLENAFTETVKAHYRYSIQFVLENLTSLTSMAALYQELSPEEFVFGRARDLQYFKLVSDSLSKYYPKHRHVLALKRNFQSMYQNFKIERLLSTSEVQVASLPDITLPGTDGGNKSLLNSGKRYVLLNFWNENDPVSFQWFKDYHKSFKKYNNSGFTIYNVYAGSNTSAWIRVVNFEEITDWLNVVDIEFPDSPARSAYNVQNLPANYLIDLKENTILAKDVDPTQLNIQLQKIIAN
ncbi:MAG: redoxin domain-containing protein [Bacteroidota bacterium]|nr:MAG: redoxin domain-containing protein [Bacteroidota bacterium]